MSEIAAISCNSLIISNLQLLWVHKLCCGVSNFRTWPSHTVYV